MIRRVLDAVGNFVKEHPTLCLGLLCGVVGAVVDADHLPTVFGIKLVPPLNLLGLEPERFLHTPILLLGCLGIACVGGCMAASILIEWLRLLQAEAEHEAMLVAHDGRLGGK